MKREAANHTKMKRLCRRLDLPRYIGMGIMEALWHLTATESPAGDIGKLSDEDIALGIDYRGDEHALVAALVDSGWLDRHPENRLVVHDWWDHAEDSVHMKLARLRRFFADGRAPKLVRLPSREREAAEKFFGPEIVNVCTEQEGVATEYGNVRTADCLPSPPIPSHTLPSPPIPEERTVAESSAVVASPAPERVRSFDSTRKAKPKTPDLIRIPDKPMNQPPPPRRPPGEDKSRILRMSGLIHAYLAMRGTAFERDVKPPDDNIVLQCLTAVGNAPLDAVEQFLRRRFVADQSPRHPNGPHGYGWFPTILASADWSSLAPPRPTPAAKPDDVPAVEVLGEELYV